MNGIPVVLFLDCGDASGQFAKAAGLIQRLAPHTDVSAGQLNFEKGNVRQVAAFLYTTVRYWPDGSVFVSLVGEGRPAAALLSNGSVILSPDNGTATMCAADLGLEKTYLVDTEKYGDDEWTLIRCAAALAGEGVPSVIGPGLPVNEFCLLALPSSRVQEGLAEGSVAMLLKTFGNITFSIPTAAFEQTGIKTGDSVLVTFTKDGRIEYREKMTYQPSFGYVPEGEPVIFNGSSGYMDIGLNKDSFIAKCLPQILEEKDPDVYHVRIEKISEVEK